VDPGSAPRWRIPAEDGLLLAVGRAVYSFAQLGRSVERVRQDLLKVLGDRFAGLSPERAVAELEASLLAEGGPQEGGLPADLARVLRRYCGLRAWRDGLLGLRPQGDSPSGNGAAANQGSGQDGEPTALWRTESVSRMAREIELTATEANRLLRKHA
jgi:hypothetical protein